MMKEALLTLAAMVIMLLVLVVALNAASAFEHRWTCAMVLFDLRATDRGEAAAFLEGKTCRE
jgi:hypothetical protein